MSVMTTAQLAALVERFDGQAPVSAARFPEFSSASAKAQWLSWLSQYHTTGAYNRKMPGTAARQVYARLQSPTMLLWLCEQAGLPRARLEAAADAAAGHASKAASSGAFRRVLPWDRVEAALKAATQATIDTPFELGALIEPLSPDQPLTDRFSARWRAQEGADMQKEQKNVWYATQHEHWMGWLRGYEGAGAYGRQNWDRTAAFVYNHIVNPQMLIYLAEALGFEDALVEKASTAALSAGPRMAGMSGAIRAVFPWPIVEQALFQRAVERARKRDMARPRAKRSRPPQPSSRARSR